MNLSDLRLPPRRRLTLAVSLFILPLLASAGCDQDLDTTYGQRQGPGASLSVNGTAVLGEMFAQAGHKVSSWEVLSPRLKRRADCIVWFPDDFRPPSKKVRSWLVKWLLAKRGRTLIYVGRDFDAAPWYWEKVLPLCSAEQAETIRRHAELDRQICNIRREDLPKSADCEWFTVRRNDHPHKVRSLSGEPDWTGGIESAKLEIQLAGRIVPAARADLLLASEDDALVSSLTFGDSELIVVANGSFLLNAMLVNHEHRKLAEKLIGHLDTPGQNVVFLESGAGGPPIQDQDPSTGDSAGLEIFLLWPTNWILMHLAAVGIIFCFSRWPIFGLPQQAEPTAASDFGRHIDALAELLKRSRERSYAMSRVEHYQQAAENVSLLTVRKRISPK